jgi:LPS export ABC transporter protein LptC
MDNIKITHKKDGIIKWHVGAKKAVFADANQVKLETLKVTFPEKKLVLNSDSGTYNSTTQSIKIEGNIKAETNNYTISALNLSWDASKSELSSDKKIQIVGKEFIIEGDELSASTDKARLNSNIKAVFK